MAADKFILPAKKRMPSNNPRGEVIRISSDAYNLLVDMGNESTLTMGKIASEAIAYAYEHLSLATEEV